MSHVNFLRSIGVRGTAEELEDVSALMPGHSVSPYTGKPTVWNPKEPCPTCGPRRRNQYGGTDGCWDWMYYQEPCQPWLLEPPVPVSRWVVFIGILLLSETAS